jgi:hypothetical protein
MTIGERSGERGGDDLDQGWCRRPDPDWPIIGGRMNTQKRQTQPISVLVLEVQNTVYCVWVSGEERENERVGEEICDVQQARAIEQLG